MPSRKEIEALKREVLLELASVQATLADLDAARQQLQQSLLQLDDWLEKHPARGSGSDSDGD